MCRSCQGLGFTIAHASVDRCMRCRKFADVLQAGLAAQRVLAAVLEVRDILWPEDDVDAEWEVDTIEHVARALDEYRPAGEEGCEPRGEAKDERRAR